MNKDFRICMIGAGRVGKLHSKILTRYVPGVSVTGIVDTNEVLLNETADQFTIKSRFISFDDALLENNFDAVVITTPTFTHADLTIKAANAKKHVFCEKPMAISIDECDLMIKACNENGINLQIGFMRRYDPEFVTASERIFNGEIGDPMMIKSLTHGPGLPPPWACDLKTSNGMLAEVNSHDWDCVRWLMGSNPQRIYAEVANFKGEARGVTTENFYDNVLVTIKFDSGALGNISGICPCDYGYDARVEIVGTKGIMQIGSMNGQDVIVCTNRDQGLITPIYRTWPQRFEWGYIHELSDFVECAVSGKTPRVGGIDGRWAVVSVLAGTKSFLESRPVNVSEVLA